MGYDHILFILCLFFYTSKPKTVLLQCTIFTLAHSLALGLSASGIVIYNSKIIEPLIALTILYTAIENIFFAEKSKIRYLLIFIFGLRRKRKMKKKSKGKGRESKKETEKKRKKTRIPKNA